MSAVLVGTLACTPKGSTYDLATIFGGASEVVVKEKDGRVRTITDPRLIAALVAWAGKRSGWSEHPVGMAPCCAVTVEFNDAQGQLIGGIGVGDATLWYCPSVGATTQLSAADRAKLLGLLQSD